MAEIEGTFRYPDGLTPGQSEDGGLSQLLYNSEGSLVDHGSFFPSDDRDDQSEGVPLDYLIAAALVIGGFIGGAILAPRVKRWWQEKAYPHLRTLRVRGIDPAQPAALDGPGEADGTDLATLSQTAPADFSNAVDVALEDCRNSIGSDEAQRRLIAILAAAAFIADQMRILANARLEDEDDADLLQLRSAINRLTTQEVTGCINHMLEANTSLLDEETSSEFLKIFGGGQFVNGKYVPLSNDRITEALRLPGG